jgi:small-conductance mechanosensitive channel
MVFFDTSQANCADYTMLNNDVPDMRRKPVARLRQTIPVAVLGMMVMLTAAGQDPDATPPTPPISLPEIPVRAAAVNASLSDSEELLTRAEVLDEIERDLTEREISVAAGLVALRRSLGAAASREALAELEQDWRDTGRILKIWDDDLRQLSGILEKELARLDSSAAVWASTIEQARAADVAKDLVELARGTAAAINRMRESLGELQGRTFALQGKLGRAQTSVQTALDRIEDEQKSLLNNLLRRERPALWSEAVTGASIGKMAARATNELSKSWDSIRSVVSGEYDRLAFQGLLLIVIGLLLRRARTTASGATETDPVVQSAMAIFERPFAIATLIALLLTPRLYVSTPPAVDDAVALLLLAPVLRLLLPLVDAPIRPALYVLAGLYLIDWLRDLLEAAPLVARIIFLIEMVAAAVLAVWLIRSEALHGSSGAAAVSRWRSSVRFGLEAVLGLVCLAALATAAGFVRLGVLLGAGVLNSAYLAVLLVAVARAAEALMVMFLRSRVAGELQFIAQRGPALRNLSVRFFRIAGIAIWLFASLELFALRDFVVRSAKAIFFTELQAGAISVSLADFLVFGAAIVVAVFIARFVTTLLDEDVYPRLKLGRGVPFAISAVIKYGIIAVGFLFAIGAMGIGMDRITILLGAFGVGLGFGLQTIVNSFVSGMILIFERPVQVGDSVEVGSVKGRITRIGIRSSTIRSFEGAEITVPNGTLLSDALTNWTMSDRHRRVQVSVGVAYGSNPDEIIQLLEQAVAEQDGLLAEPAPVVIFNGFGDSSLDFVLRAWVEDNDQFVTIQSSLALAVNRILVDHGIEIPFPQRDLHLRSVPPGVSSAEPPRSP